LHNTFDKVANKIARETAFVQRKSKLTGSRFLSVWVLGFIQHPQASLNLLSQVAEDIGVRISRQGIQKRLTPSAVSFLKKMFEYSKEALQNRIPISLPLLTQFTAIELVDSSQVALPDELADEFAGAGGDGPQATMKLQTVWEFLHGNLSQVVLQSGRHTDQGFRGHLAQIVRGGLFLCDLGYFCTASLQAIANAGAYFVSRLDTKCVLYDPMTEERFDLLHYLGQSAHNQHELQLQVTRVAKLPCRVLAVRLPADVVDERRRKAKANARRKGRTLSAEKLAWLEWNVYITNVPQTMLTFTQTMLLYSLRWQIELLFKLWKSESQLDRVAGRLRERVLCEIYAKLIGMVLFQYLSAPLRWAERELSPTKALQTLQRHVLEMAKTVHSVADLQAVLDFIFRRWQRFALKDKRRSHPSTLSKIQLAMKQPSQATPSLSLGSRAPVSMSLAA
jgi:hypothetical protein